MTDALTDPLARAVATEVDALRPDAVRLLHGVRAAQRRRARRQRWTAAAAVTAAAGATAAVALVVPALERAPRPVPPQPAVPDVPAGRQAVSWHGVEVLVPATWRLDAERCGAPTEDTVLRPGIVLSCLGPQVRGLTVVSFQGLSDDPRTLAAQLAAVATTPVEVSGTPALRGSRPLTDESGVERVLVVPSEQVVVSVRSPDAAAADALLDATRVVEVDAAGCRSRLPAAQPAGPSTREGAETSLVPGTPTGASLCEYGGLRLERSRRLDATQVRELQARLDALPTGRSGRVPVDEIAPDYCTTIDRDVTVLDVGYPDGPGVQVFAKEQGCTDRSPTNGSTTRRLGPTGFGELLRGRVPSDDLDRTRQRPQPAPELGYVALPDGRADLLAGTDSDRDPRLVGVVDDLARRCLSLLPAGSTRPSTVDCLPQTAPVVGYDGGPTGQGRVVLASVEERTRSVRVLVDGRQVAVWRTYGGGAAYGQRRFALGLVTVPGRVELVGLEPSGRETGRGAV